MFSFRTLAFIIGVVASLATAQTAAGSTEGPAKAAAKSATTRPVAARPAVIKTTRLKPVLVAPTTDIFHDHRTVALTGAVTNADGLPLPGATVWLTATRQQFTVTNAEGEFVLTLPSNAPASLTIGYEGYEEQVVVLSQPGQQKGLLVELKATAKSSRR